MSRLGWLVALVVAGPLVLSPRAEARLRDHRLYLGVTWSPHSARADEQSIALVAGYGFAVLPPVAWVLVEGGYEPIGSAPGTGMDALTFHVALEGDWPLAPRLRVFGRFVFGPNIRLTEGSGLPTPEGYTEWAMAPYTTAFQLGVRLRGVELFAGAGAGPGPGTNYGLGLNFAFW